MEVHINQAYSFAFEDQMAIETGGPGQFPVLIRSLLGSLQPPKAALSNKDRRTRSYSTFNC